MKSLFWKFILVTSLMVPAFADTFVFNTPANTGLGATHDFTFGTATIHAAAFNGGNLFSKAGGGDEDGLGLTGDPSHDKEIWVKASGTQDFIQLDLADLISKGYTGFTFQMGSTTHGEGWSVSACSTNGTDCGTSPVAFTNDELTSHNAPGNLNATNHYLDFMATGPAGSNVLLHSLSATAGGGGQAVPEPTSVVLLGTALLSSENLLCSGWRSTAGERRGGCC